MGSKDKIFAFDEAVYTIYVCIILDTIDLIVGMEKSILIHNIICV